MPSAPLRSTLSRFVSIPLCFLLLYLISPSSVRAYAVLSHEAIIDSAWETNIKPLLLKRFPNATEDDLSRAQAYVYGGAIIQDMGYYPYGSPFFSDLAHYVRSGDFIQALLQDAQDLNEYAFAVGALAHYAADNEGHRIGTNRAVPLLYPGLRKKFGDSVAYEDNTLAHVKTEFGFDVLEIAHERYAPESYHDFIGFEISRKVLDQAFRETYGLELKDVLLNEENKDDLPDATRRRFLYNLSRSNYERESGKDYSKPNPGERFLAFLYKLIPKFGPLKVLQFRTPTPRTEQMFEASFNATLERYRKLLTELREGHLEMANDNFDVGERTGPGIYRLNDDAHAHLVDRLAATNFSTAAPELRDELLHFFAEPDASYSTKRDLKVWAKLQTQLQQLKSLSAGTASTETSKP